MAKYKTQVRVFNKLQSRISEKLYDLQHIEFLGFQSGTPSKSAIIALLATNVK